MLKTRPELEANEKIFLSPYAMKSAESIGRVYAEPEDNSRLPFQRDRDRIIHSKAFRRLQAKTQVMVSYMGDHYRDRMTHSIEVSQIARDISRTLGLNEDLSECLALAHDLGHPPFGHGGEYALDEMMRQHGLNFEHNEQSRRVVEKLEKIHPDFDGLNVTKEVLDGLLKHNPHNYQTYINFEISPHLEGQIVDLADEIAYTNHDVDDGIRSGLITLVQLRQFKLWKNAEAVVIEESGIELLEHNDQTEKLLRSRIISRMISHMIVDLQTTTAANLQLNKIDSLQKVRNHKKKLVEFSPEMQKEIEQLRLFLMNNFYLSNEVEQAISRGKNILKKLFTYYVEHPDALPQPFSSLIKDGVEAPVVIKDYIAGMTDHYAEDICTEITKNPYDMSKM